MKFLLPILQYYEGEVIKLILLIVFLLDIILMFRSLELLLGVILMIIIE